MRYGQMVEVLEAFENKQLKRVVSEDSRNVYVCTEDEFNAAVRENRQPICIGFPRQFVLRIENEGREGKIRHSIEPTSKAEAGEDPGDKGRTEAA